MINFNWAVIKGKIKLIEEYKGLAYRDMEIISLDEIDEYVLALTKEYGIPWTVLMDDTTYTDVCVMYAKLQNEKAFESYNQYISLDDKAKGKYVMDYGEPKPYLFKLITAEMQQEYVEEEEKKKNSTLHDMYQSGGRFL